MIKRTFDRRFRVAEHANDYRERLEGIFQSWTGTRYCSGQARKGVGVDCIRYVCSIWDELRHREPTDFPDFPHDQALHDREGAIRAMLRVVDYFKPVEFVKDEWIEPGDIVMVGPGGSPAHALIVGTWPSEFWHASQFGITRAGQSYFQLTSYEIGSVLRSGNREEWSK